MALTFEQRPASLAGNSKPEIRGPKADGGVVRGVLAFEQQPRESQRAFAAFSLYLSQGPDRSLSAVGAKLGKGKRQMEKWSRRWSWAERVTAYGTHMAELERRAIEDQAVAQGVEWAKMTEPVRREAWLEAERAIAMVRKARERWEESGRTPGFEGMARMLELAFKLKQFAAGMPSEIKETHTLVTGKVSVEWEAAIRKAYGVVDVEEVQRTEVGDQRPEAAGSGVPALPEVKR
jgi:hypothetical protein